MIKFSRNYTRARLKTPIPHNQKVTPSLCIKQAYLFTPEKSSHFLASQSSIQITKVIFIVCNSHRSSYFTIKASSNPTMTTVKYHNLPPLPSAKNLTMNTYFDSNYVGTSAHAYAIWLDLGTNFNNTHRHPWTYTHIHVFTNKKIQVTFLYFQYQLTYVQTSNTYKH